MTVTVRGDNYSDRVCSVYNWGCYEDDDALAETDIQPQPAYQNDIIIT